MQINYPRLITHTKGEKQEANALGRSRSNVYAHLPAFNKP
jgi:hypothetical protein